MEDFDNYKKLGWKYEYEKLFGCFILVRPDGRIVFKDYDFCATLDDILKIIKNKSFS